MFFNAKRRAAPTGTGQKKPALGEARGRSTELIGCLKDS
jgi:hypothetical protein